MRNNARLRLTSPAAIWGFERRIGVAQAVAALLLVVAVLWLATPGVTRADTYNVASYGGNDYDVTTDAVLTFAPQPARPILGHTIQTSVFNGVDYYTPFDYVADADFTAHAGFKFTEVTVFIDHSKIFSSEYVGAEAHGVLTITGVGPMEWSFSNIPGGGSQDITILNLSNHGPHALDTTTFHAHLEITGSTGGPFGTNILEAGGAGFNLSLGSAAAPLPSALVVGLGLMGAMALVRTMRYLRGSDALAA